MDSRQKDINKRLMIAIEGNDYNKVKALLEEGARPWDVYEVADLIGLPAEMLTLLFPYYKP